MSGSTSGEGKSAALWSDIKDVWAKATYLSVILVALSYGLPAVVTFWLSQQTRSLDPAQAIEPIHPLIEVVFRTWPIVTSAAILIVLIMRGSLAEMSGFDRLFAIGGCVAVPYLIAYYFGALGYGDLRSEVTRSWLQLLSPAHLIWFLINILSFYLSPPRLIDTISALLAGGFFAWAFQIKLLPHVEQLREG